MVRRIFLASSSSFFVFFSPKPGLRGGDKSLLFSVAKRTTGAFSRIYRPGGRGRGKQGWGGVVWGRMEKRNGIKSRSSLNQINRNQLHRTGDGIASLKIQ